MKILKSIKFEKETHDIIEEIKKSQKMKTSFNAVVEGLVESNPDFILHKKKRKVKKVK